jgi:cytoskeleton protein RodZ
MAVRRRIAEEETGEHRGNIIDAAIAPRRLSVGETLRNRRLECGLEIDHVAQVLRIRPSIIDAIEGDRFDQLPGPAYAIGFVRSYATYLGLDAVAIVVRFKAESGTAAGRPRLSFPLPVSDSRVPTGPLLVICVLLAALVYGGWYFSAVRPGQLTAMVGPVPERLRHMLDSSAPAVQPAQAPPNAQPRSPERAAAQIAAVPPPSATQPLAPAQPSTAAPAPPASGPPQATAAPPAVDGAPPVESRAAAPAVALTSPDIAQPTAGQGPNTSQGANQGASQGDAKTGASTYGATDSEARVVLRATAESWVQIRDKNGALLFTRVLKPGESYNVPNQDGLTMVAGNAGGLDVAVDGVDVPHLGDLGRVVRNVSLDPDHLLGAARHAN